ncbi:MAG: inositol monophosphatase [Pirellulaceae bacterium]
MVIDPFFEVCEEAARVGGRILCDFLGCAAAREKGPRDLVTEADLASQEAIRDMVLTAFPDHRFVGEEEIPGVAESTPEPSNESPYRWIVDPLDGTVNYVHQMPTFSVSVALERAGEILVGVVYDPIREECFSARAHGGAHLNGTSLQTSDCSQLSEALVAASFSANVQRGSPEIDRFIDVLVACQSMRRLGSAALNLSYVAAGRLDAYYATNVRAWDVAAGILIVRESGGVVASIDGTPFQLDHPKFVAASSRELHAQLIHLLGGAQSQKADS